MFNGLCYLLSRPERNEKYLRKRELKSCGNRLSLDTNVTLVRAFSRPVPEDGDRTPWVVSPRAEGSGVRTQTMVLLPQPPLRDKTGGSSCLSGASHGGPCLAPYGPDPEHWVREMRVSGSGFQQSAC